MKRILLVFCAFFAILSLASAQKLVKGTIKDNNGDPIIGANVVAKGTTIGTITNADGMFSLSVPQDAKILVVSYTGYVPREIVFDASGVVELTLEEGVLLQETVVTGFGIKKDKSNLGYAVGEISAEDLTTARTTNVTNALVAKVPGVRLSGTGGSFTGSNILIRGYTTFTGSNQPLVIIDGIPVDNGGGNTPLQNGTALSNRLIDVNQEDIESISVLKGAAATALYGSRASAGVLLITTKKGKIGQKAKISYTANYAFQNVNRIPDYQNDYGQGVGGNFNPTAISSWGPKLDGRKVVLPAGFGAVVGRDSTDFVAYPDNVKDLFQTGNIMQHNLAFEGAAGKSTAYRLSVGYLGDKGVLENNKLDRYNVGLNLNSGLTDRLSAGMSVNYSLNRSQRTQQGNQLSNPLFRTWFTPRSWDLTGLPYQDAVGNQLHYDPVVDNPIWSNKNNLYDDEINRIIGNVNFTYKLTDWLNAEYRVGMDRFDFFFSAYDQIGARGGANTNANQLGGIRELTNVNTNLNSTLLLTGQKDVNKFLFNYTLGHEVYEGSTKTSDLIGRTLVVRNYRNLNGNAINYVPFYEVTKRRVMGVFGSVDMVYNNYATLNVSLRNDWNSTLPVDNNSYLYYSVAGTYNITAAFPSLKSNTLNLLKVRGNYGRVGKGADFLYATETYFAKPNPADGFGPNIVFPFNNLAGYTLNNQSGNPDLKPEFTTTYEAGIDLGMFNNKINLELTAYTIKSTDIILSAPVSSASGVSNVIKNSGSLTTNGIEFALGITPVRTKDFQWTSTFNFTSFRSVVDELAPGVSNIFLGGFVTPNTRLVAGDEYGQLYGSAYRRDSLGRLLLNANGLPQPTTNVVKIGNPNPRYLLGINNEFNYKGWNLSVLLDIKVGGDQYSRNLADIQRNGVGAETAEKDRFNADGTVARNWLYEGVLPNGKLNGTDTSVFVTAEQYWGNSGKHIAAEGFIHGTSWFRIREASLSYTFPSSMFKGAGISGVTLGVFGRNLFLYAPDYPHLDPEQNALGINNAQGLEFNALPSMRTIGVNLNATF